MSTEKDIAQVKSLGLLRKIVSPTKIDSAKWTVACPVCNAEIGRGCYSRDRSRRSRRTHGERIAVVADLMLRQVAREWPDVIPRVLRGG